MDSKDLLSLNKLNALGTLITKKEKQNEEMPSCDDENKGNNVLDQFKFFLAAQSAQIHKQTDLILERSDDLHKFVITKADNTDHLIASFSDKTELALDDLNKELDKTGVALIDVKNETADV